MRYRLDSMLPLRAFSPRSGRARGFASGGMTLEGDGGQQYWQDAPPPDSSVTVEAAPPEFNNASPVQTGSGQGGGTVDQATLNQLYETYLGRAPDEGGSQTWTGQDINSVIAGITNSQEYANRGGGGGGGGDGGTDLTSLYQTYLGRAPDESGAQTYAGWSTQDVTNAILGSQEYANRGGNTNNTQAPTDVNALYQQYLGRGVDQSGAQTWAGQSPEAIIAGITGSAEYQNLHPGAQPITSPDANTIPEDPSQWIPQVIGTEYHGDSEPTKLYQYIDQKTGNVYDSQSVDAKLIASGAAARDTYLSKLNIDAAEKQNLYDLKAKDPNTYYDTVAQKLKDQVYEAYTTNANYDTDLKALDTLSTVAPQAYYKAQLEFLGKQIGWQTGQNTSDRAAPAIEKIKAMAPEAYQAGISEKDINSIVNTAANEANVQNQIRIAREGAEGGGGFNFGKDVMPGVAMIAIAAATVATAGSAAPLGAAMLGAETAAAVGTVATAALGGTVIGAGMGVITAAAYGGNIEQGAIKGAISGAIGGAAGGAIEQMNVTASGLVSSETVIDIAKAVNLTKEQVSAIIVNTTATAIAAAATGQVNSSNFAQVIATALASSAISEYAQDIAKKIDPTMSAAAINAVSSVARVATTATLNGGSVQRALITNIPAIISGSVSADMKQKDTVFDPYATENVGLTSGAVDKTLNQGLVDNYINLADDPIRAYAAQNNITGNPLDNIRYTANVMLDQNMPRQDIISNLAAVYNVDEKTAENYFQNTVANNAFERLAAKAEDPIALLNAAKMLTGDKQENLKFVADEMKNQGLSKSQISTNLEDLYQIPKDKAEAYTDQLLGNKSVVSTANNFADAFKEARGAGAKTFEWNGKQYTTALAPPPSADKPEEPAKTPMQILSEGLTPKAKTFQEAVDFAKDTAPMFESGIKRFTDRLSDKISSTADNLTKTISATNLPTLEDIKNSIPTFDVVQKSIETFLSPNAAPGTPNILTGAKEVTDALVDVAKNAPAVAQWAIFSAIGDTISTFSTVALSPFGRENAAYLAGKALSNFGTENLPKEVQNVMNEQYKTVKNLVDTAPAGTKELVAIKAYLQYPMAFVKVGAPEILQDTMFMGVAGMTGVLAKMYTGLNAMKVAIGTELALDTLDGTFSGMGRTFDTLRAKGVSFNDAQLPSVISGLSQGFVTLGTMGYIDATIMRRLAGDIAEFTTKGVASLAAGAYAGAWSRSFLNTGIDDIAAVAGNPKDSMSNFSFNLNKMNTAAAMDAPISAISTINQAVIANFSASKLDTNVDTNQFLKLAPPANESQSSWQAPKLLEGPQRLLPAPSSEQIAAVKDTQNTISQTLQQAGIPADQANSMAIKTIGSELVEQINTNITTETGKLDPNKVLGKDAAGNPITFSDVFGSLATNDPVIQTESNSPSDVQHNDALIKDIKTTLQDLLGITLDNNALVPQTQRSTETKTSEGLPFAEKPDISRLFSNETLFGTDLTVPQNQTQTQTDTATKTRGELIYGKPSTQTLTDTNANLKTITDPLTATSVVTSPQTQTDTQLQTVNPVKTDIALKDLIQLLPQTQTLTQLEPVNPRPVPVDMVVMDPLTPTSAVTPVSPPSGVKPPGIITPSVEPVSPTSVTVVPTEPTNKSPKTPSTPALKTPATVVKKKKKINPPDLLADFAKGRKIALPLAQLMKLINTQPSNVIPMQNYQNPNTIPFNLEDELKAAKAGGLMRLATGGGSGGSSAGATPGSNISVGPGDASYSPIANFIKGSETKSYLPEKYDLQMFSYAPTPYNAEAALKAILAAAEGGIVHMADGGDTNPAFDPGSTEVKMKGKKFAYHQPFVGLNMMSNAPRFNYGGEVGGHNPQFFSEGGLNAMENRYVTGEGDGTSDSIPAMLANGEFVIPADVVSSLGNGSNDSGASVLDEFLKTIRAHKTRENKNGLPPDSKGALGYLLEAKRKVRA